VVQAVMKTLSDYENKSVKESEYRFTENSIKYALFPVWIQKTSWNNEEYVFAMNGQTGKFVGRVPVDKMKVTISWFVSTLITTIIGGFLYKAVEADVGTGQAFMIAFIACAVVCGIVHAIIVAGNNNVASADMAMEYGGELVPGDSSDAFVRTYTETRSRK
jgi:hypothetical protein